MKNGLIEEFYDNGKLESRKNWKEGKKDGLSEEFHKKNGRLIFKKNFKNGILDGLYEEFYKNGQLRQRVNYVKGEKEGYGEHFYYDGLLYRFVKTIRGETKILNRLSQRTSFKNGRLVLIENFYKNGKLSKRLRFKGLARHGLSEFYDEEGNLTKTIEYKNGFKLKKTRKTV